MTQSGSRFKRTSSPNASNLKASFARWLEFRSPFFREIFMSGCKLLPAALSRLTYRLVCSSLSLPTLQKSLCSKIEGAKNVRSELRTQVRSASESVFWLELRFVRRGSDYMIFQVTGLQLFLICEITPQNVSKSFITQGTRAQCSSNL